jgi:hypothetical protein
VQALTSLYLARHPIYRDPFLGSRMRNYKARRLESSGPVRSVVLLGSSRFYNAMRERVLETTLREKIGEPVAVHNWYHFATGCFSSLFQFERLKRQGERPDLVVVEVVPAFLCKGVTLHDANTLTIPARRLSWEDAALVRRYNPERTGLTRELLQARLAPLYSHRIELLTHLMPRLVPDAARCYRDYFLDNDRDPPIRNYEAALERSRQSYAFALEGFRPGGEELSILRDCLRELRAAGVPTVVIAMPEGPVFRSWYRPGAWEEMSGAVTDLCHEFAARFVNAREWLDAEKFFFDSHHTTRAGGERFSRRLAEEVLAPLLCPPSSEGGRPGAVTANSEHVP